MGRAVIPAGAQRNAGIHSRHGGELRRSGEEASASAVDMGSGTRPERRGRGRSRGRVGSGWGDRLRKRSTRQVPPDPSLSSGPPSLSQLRRCGYRALRQKREDIIPLAKQMAKDSSAFMRREVAISLRDIAFEKKKDILLLLAKRFDGNDRWYLETLGTSLEGNESKIYPELIKMLAKGKRPPQWNKQMASLAWRLHPPEAVNDLLARATDPKLTPVSKRAAITSLAFINDKNAAQAMLALSKNKSKEISGQAAYWLAFRQGNDWNALIDWKKINVNTRYERTLAEMKVHQQVIADRNQSIYERRQRVEKMAKDSVGGQLLIGMASQQTLPEDLVPFIEKKIFANPNAVVRSQASKYFKQPVTSSPFTADEVLTHTANAARGKTLFTVRCASCHKINDTGGSIGPELTSIGKKFGKADLAEAIINPSAAIVFGYEAWLVNTRDGSSLFGFLVSSNDDNIVLRDVAGQQHVVKNSQVKSKQKQEKSLMPDAIANGLNSQDVADLLEYLEKLR